MNSLETDSHIIIDRSYYSENLLYNSELSTEYKILSFSDEIAAKENTEKVYTLYCHYINLHLNKKIRSNFTKKLY